MTDYNQLRNDVEAIDGIGNAPLRAAKLERVKVLALIDIAERLAGIALGELEPDELLELIEPDETEAPEVGVIFDELEVGDPVTGGDGQLRGRIIALSLSEGDDAATVEWADGTSGRVWVSELWRAGKLPLEGADETPEPVKVKTKKDKRAKADAATAGE